MYKICLKNYSLDFFIKQKKICNALLRFVWIYLNQDLQYFIKLVFSSRNIL